MNGWIDSHSHLFAKEFDEDIDEVIQRCLQINVKKVILPNIDLMTLDRVKKLSDTYPEICLPTVGLHPCDVKEDFWEVLNKMKTWAYEPKMFIHQKIYAIGETGLDFYWDTTFAEQQKKALKIQIEWAKELRLPIILHTRNSIQETIDIIRDNMDEHLKGVFHCFGGTIEEAQQIIELGSFYLGVDGPLTYKNSKTPAIFQEISLEKILLETDSPFLPPTPHRGKRNESSYLPLIAQKLAEVKNMSLEEVRRVTTENCSKLFGIESI
ncbi:MAG: TatD family hydrolase [Chitinophagales bacterium]|nr:TatD family hydrolase [Chitinophagales bacterium]